MARAATSPELALFRTPGQWSRYRAAIYSPATIYTARINGTISPLDKVLVIPYDGGSGTLANVLPDMTVFIGSTAGAWDKGIARLRSIDSDEVFIGETADIRFLDNDHLTIVDDFGLWAKPIFISAGVIYMDGGVAYSDQHTNYLPLIRGGPTARIVEKTGSSVSLSFDFPATVPGSSVSSRSTSAPGAASITGGTTQTPSISWNSVGWKSVYHTVTGANGKSNFIARKVFVWDSSNLPEPVEITQNPRGDVDSGGWGVSLKLYDSASLSLVRDRALIVLFAEDHYGDTEDEIGPVSGSENIAFEGWIGKESIDWKSQGGGVELTAYGPQYFLQKIPAWPDGVEFTTGTPANWTQIKNLTVDLGLVHHFLMWRTTAPRILDVFPSGDTRYSKEVSSLASDLWSQIREMAFDQIFSRALCNRLGQLFIEIHPQLIPLASRAHPTVITFLEKDLEDPISLERVTMSEASIVDLSGVYVNSAGSGKAFFSLSPGHSHSHYGSPIVINRILLSSQAQANQSAGLYRGWINNPYGPIPLRLSANNRLIDICPLQKCAISISSGDTIRGISGSLGLIPRAVEDVFDPRTGYTHQEITFEAETFEDLSTNGDIPGSLEVSFPPLPPLPPLPPIEILIPGTTTTTEPAGDPSRVLVHDSANGLLFSEDFETASPTWRAVNAGLGTGSPTLYQQINKFVITPSGEIYVLHRNVSGFGTTPFIAYAPSIGETFEIIEDQTSILAKLGADTHWGVNALGVDPISGQVAYVIGNNSVRKLYIGSGTSFSAGVDLSSFVGIGSAGTLSFGFNNWRLTAGDPSSVTKFYAISADGSTIIRNVSVSSSSLLHVPVSNSDVIFMHDQSIGALLRISQNGAVSGDFTTLIGSDVLFHSHLDNKIAVDPSGMYLMLPWDTGQRGRSSDGGNTIVGIPSLPFGGIYAYAYAGGAGVESKWIVGGGIIRFSPDFGDTWEEKIGNMNLVSPIPSLTIVKAIGF